MLFWSKIQSAIKGDILLSFATILPDDADDVLEVDDGLVYHE